MIELGAGEIYNFVLEITVDGEGQVVIERYPLPDSSQALRAIRPTR